MFREVRDFILRKCHPDKEPQVRAIFEKQPFGDLERLVTQRLLDVVEGPRNNWAMSTGSAWWRT